MSGLAANPLTTCSFCGGADRKLVIGPNISICEDCTTTAVAEHRRLRGDAGLLPGTRVWVDQFSDVGTVVADLSLRVEFDHYHGEFDIYIIEPGEARPATVEDEEWAKKEYDQA